MSSEKKSNTERKSTDGARAWEDRKDAANRARSKQKFEKGKGWTGR